METDLKVLQDWFNTNKLTPNINKSVLMLFGNSRKTNKMLKMLRVGNAYLPVVTCTTFLGGWTDKMFSWNEHVKRFLLKVKSRIGLLTVNSRKILYFA